jgi:hypothetical protein
MSKKYFTLLMYDPRLSCPLKCGSKRSLDVHPLYIAQGASENYLWPHNLKTGRKRSQQTKRITADFDRQRGNVCLLASP